MGGEYPLYTPPSLLPNNQYTYGTCTIIRVEGGGGGHPLYTLFPLL